MTDQLFTTDERKKYEALAHKRGFETLRDYMRSLIQADVEEHDVDEADLGDPAENFRIAWGQAMRGEFITLEEFRHSMEEDDD